VVELADIFREAGPAYCARFGERMLPSHRRVMQDVIDCRTPALGGQLYECECGVEHAVYHSCRNRHCPKCQGNDAERWLESQRELLLPTEYGLATCTLPTELRAAAPTHQRPVYAIVLREAAHAVLDVAGEPRFIGGRTAIMAVLHTWTRAMIYHPHVHMLFPAGGLSADAETWLKPGKRNYILPAYALAKRFRERTEVAFKKAGLYDLVPKRAWSKRWVANVKKVGAGDKALLYISRYIFRIAISNNRIEHFDGNRVTYRWIDSNTGTTKHATLETQDFIARFLQHVLPRSFVKVRYYGLWAPSCRDALTAARDILDHHLRAIGESPQPQPTNDPGQNAEPAHVPLCCPACGATYKKPPRKIPPARGPP